LGITYADGGAWWSFTTKGVLPGDFNKGNPFFVQTTMPPNPTLDWFSSRFADNYEICYDAINNDTCDTTWVPAVVIYNGPFVQTTLSSLSPNTTYYWQVRANNVSGTTYADHGYWLYFTTWWSPTPGLWKSQSGNVSFYVRPDRLTVTNFRIQVNLPGCGTYWFSVPSPAGDMKTKVDDSGNSYEFIPNGNGIKPHGYIYSSSAAYGSVVLDHAGPICDKYWSSVPLGWTATWQNNTQPSSLMLAPDGPIFLKADPGITTPFIARPDN
jgi:hypothetical protein